MKKMTVLLADDEALARDKLRRMIRAMNDAQIQIVDDASDGLMAIEKIDRLMPDLVILDIQMPGVSGMDVLKHCTHKPAVIFATAFDSYAIRAFDLYAVDYLLKPFTEERLLAAIERTKDRLKSKESEYLPLKKIIEELKQAPSNKLDRIPVKLVDRMRLLTTNEILWFGSKDGITYAHTDQALEVRYTLDELESRLSDVFFRTHRSTIVNLNFVGELVPWFAGTYKIVLKNKAKTELPLSRQKKQILRERLGF